MLLLSKRCIIDLAILLQNSRSSQLKPNSKRQSEKGKHQKVKGGKSKRRALIPGEKCWAENAFTENNLWKRNKPAKSRWSNYSMLQLRLNHFKASEEWLKRCSRSEKATEKKADCFRVVNMRLTDCLSSAQRPDTTQDNRAQLKIASWGCVFGCCMIRKGLHPLLWIIILSIGNALRL